jgi:hypothetical protein
LQQRQVSHGAPGRQDKNAAEYTTRRSGILR